MDIYKRIEEHYVSELQYIQKISCDKNTMSLGGKIRHCRGEFVETFVDIICQELGVVCRDGRFDKHIISTTNTDGKRFTKAHALDRHLYDQNNQLIAVVECKSYLDSCYYVRACSDFKRMKMKHPLD